VTEFCQSIKANFCWSNAPKIVLKVPTEKCIVESMVDGMNDGRIADARADRNEPHSGATREALRSRRRPRFLVSGVMEFWSTGVLCPVGIAPRFRGVGSALRAQSWEGLPRAKIQGYSLTPFHGQEPATATDY
jgi:hypothetical protein